MSRIKNEMENDEFLHNDNFTEQQKHLTIFKTPEEAIIYAYRYIDIDKEVFKQAINDLVNKASTQISNEIILIDQLGLLNK